MSSHNHDYENEYRYSSGHKRENFFGEILGEIPIVGELFESIGGGRIGKKGMKKICCCCAPIALLLFVPAIMLLWWIVKSILAAINIDITNIDWLIQVKNWFTNTFQFDQILSWFGGAQGILGL